MNNENENYVGAMPSVAVPLEPQTREPIFQNAGGMGRSMEAQNQQPQAYAQPSAFASAPVPSEPTAIPVAPPVSPTVQEPSSTPYIQEEGIPVMQENPNVKVAPIRLNAVDVLSQEEDYEELEEYAEPVKTEEDIDLEKRNQSGLVFITIFGLIILIFIMLLPFMVRYV
ncbi:MAG: hypothetical protein PHN72_02390 [Bacilli bacterium]|nr:hypothetical protein [Bacilli bacterium]